MLWVVLSDRGLAMLSFFSSTTLVILLLRTLPGPHALITTDSKLRRVRLSEISAMPSAYTHYSCHETFANSWMHVFEEVNGNDLAWILYGLISCRILLCWVDPTNRVSGFQQGLRLWYQGVIPEISSSAEEAKRKAEQHRELTGRCTRGEATSTSIQQVRVKKATAGDHTESEAFSESV